jgi:hypothetical protein
VGEHLRAIDLKTFAELDRGVGDRLFRMRLAFDWRQFSRVLAAWIEQIEGRHRDPGRFALQLILQHRFIGEMQRHPAALEFDLLDPALAGWPLADRRRQRRFDALGLGTP